MRITGVKIENSLASVGILHVHVFGVFEGQKVDFHQVGVVGNKGLRRQ